MQQTSTRPTRNQVVMPRTSQMNPSQTKTSKEDASHLKQITRLHSHSNSRRLRKAAKKTPSSMDHDMIRKGVHRAILQSQQIIGLKDQLPQHPQHKLEDHHRLPPASNTNHQDPLEHNHTIGSTKASTQGPGATKSKKALANTSPATQPSGSTKKHYHMFLMWRKWPLE